MLGSGRAVLMDLATGSQPGKTHSPTLSWVAQGTPLIPLALGKEPGYFSPALGKGPSWNDGPQN